jgi:hypothetical protein
VANDIRAALAGLEKWVRWAADDGIDFDWRRINADEGEKARAALASAQSAGEGHFEHGTDNAGTLRWIPSALQSTGEWVTVPRVPTEAMTERGNQALSPWIAPAMHADDAYRAMLAAAPIAPAVASEPGQTCPHITECAACPKIAAWAGREMDAKDAAVEPLTTSYVQPVPDKCDRITWRNRYYHLPLDTPAGPSADARDAARYRWLRDHAGGEIVFDHTRNQSDGGHRFVLNVPFDGRDIPNDETSAATLAESIDAAIAAQGTGDKT